MKNAFYAPYARFIRKSNVGFFNKKIIGGYKFIRMYGIIIREIFCTQNNV